MIPAHRRVLCFLLAAGCCAWPCAARQANLANESRCAFRRTGDHFVGSCGALFGQNPAMVLKPAASITTGIWRRDLQPTLVWAGEITDKGYPNAPLELEIYKGDWGILRTEYGWFPITRFSSSPELTFLLDASREVKPDALDREVVTEAAKILSTTSKWNRADNRECLPGAESWSIYCAMEKAMIDVTGGFHHRRPAMEVVRKIVEERTAGRHYHHRLMDYNNDATTTLADVQSLFKKALTRMDSR